MKAFNKYIMKLADKIEDILFGSKSKRITNVITIAAVVYVTAIIIIAVVIKLI